MTMRIAIVYPTYQPDGQMLDASLMAIPRLRENYPWMDIIAVVADDGNDPLGYLPQNADARLTTLFDRGGPLVGLEAARGMANVFREVADRYRADVVLKCDPDTYINHPDWLEPIRQGSHFVCTANAGGFRIFGSCYAMSAYATHILAGHFNTKHKDRTAGIHFQEDCSMLHVARTCIGGVVELPYNEGGLFSCGECDEFNHPPITPTAEHAGRAFISFKAFYSEHSNETNDERRAKAIADIKRWHTMVQNITSKKQNNMTMTNEKNPRISVVWFSYAADAQLLVESVKSVKRSVANLHRMSVYDDGFNAIPRSTRTWLEENGVHYEKTFYPREGNLLGPENLKGQVRAMLKAGEGADFLVKIDCDTLLLQSDWIEAMALEPQALMAGSYKGLHNYPMGHCYAVRCSALPALVKDVETYPGWAACFEDYEIGTRLHRIANGDMDYALRWRSGVDDGFWLCGPDQVTQAVLNARVVSCGFGIQGVPLEQREKYKFDQAQVMAMVNSDVEKAKEALVSVDEESVEEEKDEA